ncbi:hypothetical protein FOZ61_000794 [Perkinsus olseni]|uniref:Uncharacterized protein n=1 Tax=Perkinsus olseni TaxID=32597 RepID=A0A7J6KTN0_PEROL|nr:hypothetical protein FOZ61_000794 [Perkinsus olseni]KAF4650759.1 hypothetical protein FOL46_000738 [Perkinsus olseni]
MLLDCGHPKWPTATIRLHWSLLHMHVSVPPLRTMVAMRCQYVSIMWREHASCDLVADVLMEITAFLDDVSNSLAFCSEEVELSRKPVFIFFHEGVLRGVFEEEENLVLSTLPSLSDPHVIATKTTHLQLVHHDGSGDRLVILLGKGRDWDRWDSKILVYDLQRMRPAGEWYTLGLLSVQTTSATLKGMAAVGDYVFFGIIGRGYIQVSEILVTVLEQGVDAVHLRSIWVRESTQCIIGSVFPALCENKASDEIAVEVAYVLDGACMLLRLERISHPRSQAFFTHDTKQVAQTAERVTGFLDFAEPQPIGGSKLFLVEYYPPITDRTEFGAARGRERKYLLADHWGMPKSSPMRVSFRPWGDVAVDSRGVLFVIQLDDKVAKLCKLRLGFLGQA